MLYYIFLNHLIVLLSLIGVGVIFAHFTQLKIQVL